MKGSDRLILLVLPLLAIAIGFWMLVLSPKREEAAELEDQIATLQVSIDQAESEIAVAEEARDAFPANYAEVVSLGAAVPEVDDQSTLISDLTNLARDGNVRFNSFQIVPGEGVTSTAPEPAPAEPTTPPAEAEAEAPVVTSAPATEAGAANLPLGATVGPAGLPVTPYALSYAGGFFDMADLFAELDSSVEVKDDLSTPVVHGRLLTIDGFALTEDPTAGFPSVAADVSVTTYLVPEEQGIAAGATPAGPAPIGSPEAPTTVAGTSSAGPAGTTAAVSP